MKRNMIESSIKKAVDWLFRIQDEHNFGWSWIQDISPNAQNTAEVVHACCAALNVLEPAQKELLTEAVAQWLLIPDLNCVLTMDYAWNLLALLAYKDHIQEFNLSTFGEKELLHAINKCVYFLLNSQNADGGFADNCGEDSTAIRSAIVFYALANYKKRYGQEANYVNFTCGKVCKWLLQRQNEDGGWGNTPIDTVHKRRQKLEDSISDQAISEQYLSNAAATGYAVMALGYYDWDTYYYCISKGIAYLERQQKPDGSFPMFVEVGIRKDVIFTYRHFGTCWALSGLLCSHKCDLSSPLVVRAVYNLLQLQDRANGGWKCTAESDIYTWSTTNVIVALSMVNMQGCDILEKAYTDIYWDWWDHHLSLESGDSADKGETQTGEGAPSEGEEEGHTPWINRRSGGPLKKWKLILMGGAAVVCLLFRRPDLAAAILLCAVFVSI